MKRATLEERKRFAAQLAERDARSRRALSGGASRAVRCGIDLRSSAEPSIAVAKTEVVPIVRTDQQRIDDDRRRYEMRRWWLERFTLDEIRELAECLQ